MPDKVLHGWYTRMLFVITFAAIIIISIKITDCYKALTVEHELSSYAQSLKKGYMDDYGIIADKCGYFGYIVEMEIVRFENEYEIVIKTDEILASPVFYLRTGDFVHITATNKKHTLQKSYTYRGAVL